MVDSNNLNVAKYIIQQTPIGHISDSVEKIKNICGEQLTDSAEIKAEIISYEEDHLKHIPFNNGKIVLSKATRDGDEFYYDQSKQIKIKVNPLSYEIAHSESIELESSLQKAIDVKLKEFKEKYYKDSVTSTNVLEQTPEKLVILISAHNINRKNCWSGEWLSFWELEKNEKDYTLKGNIKANTFYYEEGNIQFHLNTDFTDNISFGDDNKIAKDVIAKIEANENKVQIELDQVYDHFSDNYIKPLRRKIPITGTKMNWSLNQVQFNR